MSGGRKTPGEYDRIAAAELRRARVMAGMSQSAVAELMGCTYQQVNKYETGLNRICVGRFIDACSAVGVSPVEAMRRIADGNGPRQDTQFERQTLNDAQALMAMAPATRRALVRIGRIIEETSNGNP